MGNIFTHIAPVVKGALEYAPMIINGLRFIEKEMNNTDDLNEAVKEHQSNLYKKLFKDLCKFHGIVTGKVNNDADMLPDVLENEDLDSLGKRASILYEEIKNECSQKFIPMQALYTAINPLPSIHMSRLAEFIINNRGPSIHGGIEVKDIATYWSNMDQQTRNAQQASILECIEYFEVLGSLREILVEDISTRRYICFDLPESRTLESLPLIINHEDKLVFEPSQVEKYNKLLEGNKIFAYISPMNFPQQIESLKTDYREISPYATGSIMVIITANSKLADAERRSGAPPNQYYLHNVHYKVVSNRDTPRFDGPYLKNLLTLTEESPYSCWVFHSVCSSLLKRLTTRPEREILNYIGWYLKKGRSFGISESILQKAALGRIAIEHLVRMCDADRIASFITKENYDSIVEDCKQIVKHLKIWLHVFDKTTEYQTNNLDDEDVIRFQAAIRALECVL